MKSFTVNKPITKPLWVKPKKADGSKVIECVNCKFKVEHHYEDEGEEPYIKLTCGNKYGLTENYIVHDDDYCSRAEVK